MLNDYKVFACYRRLTGNYATLGNDTGRKLYGEDAIR